MHLGVVPVSKCSREPVPVVQMFDHIGTLGRQDCAAVSLSLTIPLWVIGRREQISYSQSLADSPEVFSRKVLAIIRQKVYQGPYANTQ